MAPGITATQTRALGLSNQILEGPIKRTIRSKGATKLYSCGERWTPATARLDSLPLQPSLTSPVPMTTPPPHPPLQVTKLPSQSSRNNSNKWERDSQILDKRQGDPSSSKCLCAAA